jgi:hypothetical protein
LRLEILPSPGPIVETPKQTEAIAGGCNVMAIYKLISNGSFGPDEIKIMTQAYERALIDLGIVNREDPITEFDRKNLL